MKGIAVPESRVTPPEGTFFLEVFTQPITGGPVFSAGACWVLAGSQRLFNVELRYDDSPRLREKVACRELSSGAFEYQFAIQAPCEQSAERVQVVLLENTTENLISDILWRDKVVPTLAPAPVPQLRSPLRTFAKAIQSGDCLRWSWWQQRVSRYRFLAREYFRRRGERKTFGSRLLSRTPHDAYLEATKPTEEELRTLREESETVTYRPKFSILTPLYNSNATWLKAMIDSVVAQCYQNWELLLADDASTDPTSLRAYENLPKDSRIQLIRRATNGHICEATNTAAEQATGDFVVLLDHDDLLEPRLLSRVVEALQSDPNVDLIYTDEDKVDTGQHRYDPQYKPDWSPELLLSYNYINHCTIIRRAIFEQVGRFRPGFEGAQDHDLLLRVTERGGKVIHISEILYHWRAAPSSSASSAGVKPYIHTSSRRAVDEALARRQFPLKTALPPVAEKLGLPIQSLESLHPAEVDCIRISPDDTALSLNLRASESKADLLLFLDSDYEIDPQSLSRLAAVLSIPGVALASGLILDGEGFIVSAGTLLGNEVRPVPTDAFHGVRPEPASYYFYAEVTRNISAPANGCLLIRRSHFEKWKGFDGDQFPRSLFDVDLALRASKAGFRTVHVGDARILSRQRKRRDDDPCEVLALRSRHAVQNDPYYNPNLSRWDSFVPRSESPRTPNRISRAKILFGTHNLSAFEGAPKIVRDVALAAKRAGDEVVMFAPRPGAGATQLEEAGIRVDAKESPFATRFDDGRWNEREYASVQRDLEAMLKVHRPNAILANTINLFPLIETAARLEIPSVLAIQESYDEATFGRLFTDFGRRRCERAFRLADRVIFASLACAKLYTRLSSRHNFTVVHNGLPAAPFDDCLRRLSKAEAIAQLPNRRDVPFRAVAVGSVCDRKAQHIIVEAAALVARHRRDFLIYLVGAREGMPYLDYVQHLARARGVEELVQLVPETKDVLPYLRAADLFLCASHVEAFSLSILEAEAMGLPILSTPCGGLDEQVVWNESALPFPFANPKELAENLLKLMDNPQLRERMGRSSRAAFELAATDVQMIDRYRAILQEALRS